jgi:hypothetical protein
MMSSFANPVAQAAKSAALAAVLLGLSAAVLRADESRPGKTADAGPVHCRMYFGCLPVFAKEHGRLN